MSKTKEKILKEALEQLNNRGIAQVSIRNIGDALNMSPGNLCYHFANVDIIVEALYFSLVEELNAMVSKGMEMAHSRYIDLAFIYQSIEHSFKLFQKYKFLMLDFADIMRRNKRLNQHFRQLTQARHTQFFSLLQALQAGGWIEPERYPGQFQDWVKQAMVIGDFWIASAEIMLDGDESTKRKHYQNLFFATLAPHLTSKGLEQYLQIIRP